MDPRTTLTLVGVSHRTAAVGVRERYVVNQEDLAACLSSLQQIDGVAEAFVLSTCNRTEVLVVGPRGVEVSTRLKAQLFRNLPNDHIYSYEDTAAVIHAFRVASGLDSMIVGESEILAQIKRSIDAAESAKALGSTLRALVQQALRVGKRVRTETEVGQGTLSVARVAIDVAQRAFGSLRDERALVIGAGETGVLTAKHLKERGIGALAFANRTLERARVVAAELGASAHGLDELKDLIRQADLVVACIEGQTSSIDATVFDKRAIARRDKPLLVIDLSMPRAVSVDVAKLGANVLVYDLDDLGRVVSENESGRKRAIETADAIVVAELHKFLSLRTYAAFSPAIAVLRERFEKTREDVLDAVAGARSDPRDVQLAHELARRLLDVALDQMKDSARHTSSEEVLDREYHRFLENQ
ncbi:MAG: glutamyl-tRNA reductase [Planctomycetota bacterium]|nr:glutamyl-tRNA reductase [Planctomycetota bacterium]